MLTISLTSESISEFPSVHSKKAHTISFEKYMEAICSDLYRSRVEEYRRLKALPGHEAEAQAVKDGMPCIVPAGVCVGGHAVKDLQQISGLVCIDLDHTGIRTREIFELLKQLPFVKGLHISISDAGVKAFVRASIEDVKRNYAALYAAVGRAVSRQAGHPYDEKCKILTQPCFYSWHPEAYYNSAATIFSLDTTEETLQEEQMLQMDEQKKAAPGFLVQFVDDFERRNPFRRGSRNDLALKLGRMARSKGFSESELDQLVTLFGRHYANADFTHENIRERVVAGYQFVEGLKKKQEEENRCQESTSVSMAPVSVADEETSPEEVLEKNDALRATAPYISEEVYRHLPAFLQRCCQPANGNRERDLLLLGSLNSCSALLPGVSFFYKNRLYSPHFYLAVVAPAGTGKGVMSFTSTLLDPTQAVYDRQRREKKKEYEQALLEWEQEQQQARRTKRKPDLALKPEEPRAQYLKISATTSKSQLIQSLAAAGETGCCMCTTEINTLISSLGQDYGKYEDILCKAAHHEEVSSFYKIDGEPLVASSPHLALSMAGTQEQFRLFFRSLEVGLYSRFGIYTRQQNLLWESCAPGDSQTDLHQYFLELGGELREMHQALLQSPTLVTFTDAQWERHTRLFGRQLERVQLEGHESSAAIIFRSGLLAMRLAAVLTVFRKWDDYRYAKEYCCTDRDFQSALDIVQTLTEHSLLLSTSLPESLQPPVSLHSFHRMEEVLAALPRCFTYMEFVKAAQVTGVSESTGKRLIHRAVEAQLVVKQKDGYRKKNQKRIRQVPR